MQSKILLFIKGYIIIRLQGDYVERFLNMCRAHHIFLWNIQKEEECYYCRMFPKDYFEMIPFVKKTGTKASVIQKSGLPFYIPFMKKRILFFIGIILCFLFLNVMSNYIWAIEYVGNRQVTADELQDFIEEEMIYYGMKKEKLNCEETEKRLREAFPIITWTSIYFQGTKLFVEVKENEKQEPTENVTLGSDIIADETGTIISIITRNGIPKVKAGDTVEKGQILVEGSVPVYDEAQSIISYQIYDADADIFIQTHMDYRDKLSKTYGILRYTGKERKKYFMEWNGRYIQTFSFFRPFTEYESVKEKKQLKILDNFYLPFYYGNVVMREYHLVYQEYTEKEMKTILSAGFDKFLLSLQEKGVQIIEKNVKISKNVKGMELRADILVRKETGKRSSIQQKE